MTVIGSSPGILDSAYLLMTAKYDFGDHFFRIIYWLHSLLSFPSQTSVAQ